MLNLSRNSGTYDGAAFFQDDSGIAEKKIPLNRLVSWENQPFQPVGVQFHIKSEAKRS